MITYCTCSGLTPERSRAALMATPPSLAAGKSLSAPSNRPIGVRAPLTITEVMGLALRELSHSEYLTPVRSDYRHDGPDLDVAYVTRLHRPAAHRPRRGRGTRSRQGRRFLHPGVRDDLRTHRDQRGAGGTGGDDGGRPGRR